ncbi:MAG: TIGR01212 family radical SAM protein [Firmicutes bacterium]|nr:TIGR01212 family radical SAM protein [Bacillota bacterium]
MSKVFNEDLKEIFGEQRYNSISTWLKREFGEKTIKLAIDGGFTCPNRDDSKGHGGCIFCSDNGAGEFASDVEDQIQLFADKWPRARYLAYFQNHTNTYAPVDELRYKYYEVLANPKIEGLVIGTRPDCLSKEVLELLEEINKTHFLWVELGLQTMHDTTARLINRCYDLSVFDEAMDNLSKRGIKTVVHLIMGLPGETKEMMLESVKYVSGKPGLFGMKLHLLNVVKGSQMEKLYSEYQPFSSIEEYVNLVVECLEHIPPQVTIHRLTGDAPRSILISPPWSFNKRTILNGINERLHLLDTWQGKKSPQTENN